jgi:hypothetical protein
MPMERNSKRELGDRKQSIHSTGDQILWGKNHKGRWVVNYRAAANHDSFAICPSLDHWIIYKDQVKCCPARSLLL